VSDFEGNENFMESGQIVTASPKIFPQLLQVVQAHTTAKMRA
jgi:myo-inositol-1(or 4)-monophosphatase